MPPIRSIWLAMKGVLRSARRIINEKLEPLNLSGAEGDILFLLLTGSNKLQQEQLAEQLDVGKAAVSRAVDSLESKGYVVRERRHDDRRAYSVSLTSKTSSAGGKITGIYNELYAQATKGITDDELVHIESLLSRVAQNLQSMGDR